MKDFEVPKDDVNINIDGSFMTFTRKREWLRIKSQDVQRVKGTIHRIFTGANGIFMIVENDKMKGYASYGSTEFDDGFMLLFVTVKKDTSENIILFTEITRDEARSLMYYYSTLSGPIW